MSRNERLRNGEAVELKPGIFGRINKQNRTLELDSGKVLPISKKDQMDLFPENEQALNVARKTEKLEGQVKNAPLGEFFHQLGQSGVLSTPKDWFDFATQTGDEYLATKQANRRVSERISKESPWTSGAATVASFVPDLYLTKGMSAAKAAPLLTAASSGSRIVTEPGEVAKEALISGAAGKFIDIGGKALGNIAARRGAVRDLPGQRQAITESNRLGQEAVDQANALQASNFNALKQNTKNVNEARLQQHQIDLNNRQNLIIKEKNAYEQKKFQRDAEVIRLKNQAESDKAARSANAASSDAQYKSAKQAADIENKIMEDKFKLDQQAYQKSVDAMPDLQRKAQQEYSENVIKNADKISSAFPEGSKIYSSQLGVPDFINEYVQKTGIAGSRESNQVSRILKSLFPEGEILSQKELASRYRSLEATLQKSSPEVKNALNEFKNHMGDKLPSILADNLAYSRIVPTLKKQIEKDVSSVLDTMQLSGIGISSRPFIKSKASSNIAQFFREMTPEQFLQKVRSGEMRQLILKKVIDPKDFSAGGLSSLKSGRKPISMSSEELQKLGIDIPNPTATKYDEFSNLFMNKLDNALAKAELKVIATESDAATRLGSKIKNTYGMAEPIPAPNAPERPNYKAYPESPAELPPLATTQMPPPIQTPIEPPMPAKPSLLAPPGSPQPQSFIPQPEPNLAPPNGFSERVGDFLEGGIGGKQPNTLTNNPLTKIAALKYILGPGALPLEAAGAAGYMGLKGLTSPTAAGEMARATFKQGGIMAIESWAQRYPSYRNGILESPQDRRSLTKEIEDDQEIPIEQKAVIQSKVNRGKPVQSRL